MIIHNHVKIGVSLMALYCVVDTGYGLGRSLRDCRSALLKGPKYQMVRTLLAQGSVLVLCTKFNVQTRASQHVSHPC